MLRGSCYSVLTLNQHLDQADLGRNENKFRVHAIS